MATVNNFQELTIWRDGVEVFETIYQMNNDPAFNRDRRLREQMIASAGSIPDNIAEGFERAGRAEFIHSLFIAKGEAGELMTQVIRCQRVHLINETDGNALTTQITRLSKGIHQLANYLQKSEYKGHKYKNRIP